MNDPELPLSATDSNPGKKLRRITRACDYCHKRSIRCVFPGTTDNSRCQNCIDFNQACRFDREVKRRGVKPRNQGISPVPSATGVGQREDGNAPQNLSGTGSGHLSWTPTPPASLGLVADLIEVYFETCHAAFPLFHRSTLRSCVAQGLYMGDRFTYAAIMALCALTTAGISDRTTVFQHWDIQYLKSVDSTSFYVAATKICQDTDVMEDPNFDLLRTSALLTLTAMQYGNSTEAQAHLGRYHTMVDIGNLQHEKNWPPEIGIVQREERRRLHWIMYSVDIWKSILWNQQLRVRERQTSVSYTTEVDDDFFDDAGYDVKRSSATNDELLNRAFGTTNIQLRSACWLYGLNFSVELCRILEHLVTEYKQESSQQPVLDGMFERKSTPFIEQVRSSLKNMFSALPQHFKNIHMIHYDQEQSRYGIQTLKIRLLSVLIQVLLTNNSHSPVEELCGVVSDVSDVLGHIVSSYGSAWSVLPLNQLANITAMLESVLDTDRLLTAPDILLLRHTVTSIVHLLEITDATAATRKSLDRLKSAVSRFKSATAAHVDQHHRPPTLLSSDPNYGYAASQMTQQAPSSSGPQSRTQILQHTTNFPPPNNTDPMRNNVPMPFEEPIADSQLPQLTHPAPTSTDSRADPMHWPQVWGYDYPRFQPGPRN